MKPSNNNKPFERYNPLNDFLFFKVMGEKGNEVQLLSFLNAVLEHSSTYPTTGKQPIESVEILENQSFVKDIINGKSCILDVLAVLTDGTKVNVEIQLSNQGNMERRSLYYWSKVYFEGINEGHDYRKLPNVIAINIIDFKLFPGENLHSRFNLREAANPSLILSPALEIHFINMVKWRKQAEKDIVNNPLHRWLTWFDERSPPELVTEVVNMDSGIKAADERQAYVTQDDEARRTYWSRRKAEHDRISGLNYARRDAMETAARNALAEGLSVEMIQKITGLDLKTINQLAESDPD